MQRLIDADELLERSWRWAINSREAVQQMIEGCPTVDAIPISFIEEQVKLCNEIGFRRGEECYTALIEKWREKNGTETD